jgi:hypothetical protein
MADWLSSHSLINPNQICAFGTLVHQDNPFVPPLKLIDPNERVQIPMRLDGAQSRRTGDVHPFVHPFTPHVTM